MSCRASLVFSVFQEATARQDDKREPICSLGMFYEELSLSRYVLALLLFIVALPSRAQEVKSFDEIYSGKVGHQDVIFCRQTGSDSARYFYNKFGIDIALRGPSYDEYDAPKQVSDNGKFVYKESGATDDGAAVWHVQKKGDTISGTLAIPKKRPLPIHLKRIQRIAPETEVSSECEPAIDFDKALGSAYVRAKVDRPAKVLKAFHAGGVAIEQLFEPVSKATGFRVAAHPNMDIQKKLNAYFERRFKEDIFHSLDCTSVTSMSDSPTGSLEQSANISFFTDKVLSIEEETFGYCGGAHPFGGMTGMSLDLTTGKVIQASDVFKRSFVAGDYFSEKFVDFLASYFKKSNLPEGEDLSACSDLTFVRFWMGKDDINFSGGNYRTHECGNPFSISYEQLREILNTSVLERFGVGPKNLGHRVSRDREPMRTKQ